MVVVVVAVMMVVMMVVLLLLPLLLVLATTCINLAQWSSDLLKTTLALRKALNHG